MTNPFAQATAHPKKPSLPMVIRWLGSNWRRALDISCTQFCSGQVGKWQAMDNGRRCVSNLRSCVDTAARQCKGTRWRRGRMRKPVLQGSISLLPLSLLIPVLALAPLATCSRHVLTEAAGGAVSGHAAVGRPWTSHRAHARRCAHLQCLGAVRVGPHLAARLVDQVPGWVRRGRGRSCVLSTAGTGSATWHRFSDQRIGLRTVRWELGRRRERLPPRAGTGHDGGMGAGQGKGSCLLP